MAIAAVRKVPLEGLDRAFRYAIETPLSYRPVDEFSWRQGWTDNISSSGVLFRGEQLLGINTTVEMRFKLPLEIGGDGESHVLCRGHIVRTVLPAATDQPPALAARITEYRMARGR